MKKYFGVLLLSLMLLASQTKAQRATVMPLVLGDTIVNTGTASKVITATSGYSGAAIEVLLTKISGTGAGTVAVSGSNDGVNYTAIGSAFTITNVTTQSTMFYVTAPLPVYLKVLATGSGTESVVQTVKYVLRKYNQ